MKRILFLGVLAVWCALDFTGCKSQEKSPGRSPEPLSGFSAISLAEANNHFAIDLFRQIQVKSDNLIYSPYSISTVMAMCYNGARDETSRQMSEVLYFPDAQLLNPAEQDMKNQILSNDTLPGTDISLANAIWAQENFEFLPEYIQNIKHWYAAPLTMMDFTLDSERENSRKRINQWVEDNTRQKIRDLIAPGVLTSSTRLILTNAIYFNGKWVWPFDKKVSTSSIFHINSGETMMCNFMHQTRFFPYYEDEEIQAVRLPYRNERISMTIILPKSTEGWEMISQVLNYERLNTVNSQFKETEINLSIPKFSSELNINLGRELSAMGMEMAFNKRADFSGMTGEKNLYIDEVIHKAFIEVSENGTEAAAATAAVIGLKSALKDEPVRFNADHPFLYLISDQQTGCIIFMGRLVKPSENN